MLDVRALNWFRSSLDIRRLFGGSQKRRKKNDDTHSPIMSYAYPCVWVKQFQFDNHYSMELYKRTYPVAFALESILQGFWEVAGTT